jgi:hypothetical protein
LGWGSHKVQERRHLREEVVKEIGTLETEMDEDF